MARSMHVKIMFAMMTQWVGALAESNISLRGFQTLSSNARRLQVCGLGEEVRDGVCQRCPLNHEGTSPGVCEPCSNGRHSFGGSDYCRCDDVNICFLCQEGYHSLGTEPCRPVLDHMTSSLVDPELTVNPDLDGESRVTLQFTLDRLTEVFEGYAVKYVIDIKVPDADDVYEDTCFDHHANDSSIGEVAANIALEYDDLSEGHCALSQDDDPDGTAIIRAGEVRIFVLVTIGSETREVRRWEIPLTLRFDPETHAYVGGAGMDGIALLGAETFALSPFSSTLSFMTANFDGIINEPTYGILDTVHVRHKLEDVSNTLDLEVIKVVLSESMDAGVADAFVRELTHTITVVTENEASEARFTFLAQRCEDCYLHVVSRVVHTGSRRLGGRLLAQDTQDLFVLRSLPVTMLPAQPTSETQVNLTLVVRGVDYNSLVAQSSLREQFTANLKSAVMDSVGNGVAADGILVTLSPGSVKASIAIRAPTPDDTLATMATLEDPAIQSALKEAVAQRVATMEDVHLISNGHISTELTSIEIVQVVPDEALNSDRSQRVEPWVIATAATIALFGALVILASVCFLRRRAQRKGQQQYGKEDIAECSKDVGPVDVEVKAASEDPECLHI